MPELTAENIAQRLFDLDLVADRQLREVWGQFTSRQVAAEEFIQVLMRRGLLTNYQAERLMRGEKGGYFYGHYKVLYLVGTGTFARVFRTVEKESDEVAAVKVLRRRFSEDPDKKKRFVQEGEMGKSLRHPNIVPIFEVHSGRGPHYLVMEFVEGHNLREFIRIRKKLDPLEATKLVRGVAAGLDYAFNKGVCHRDLKLSNVLVSSRGEPRLVDFGLAGAAANMSDAELDQEPNPRTVDYAGLEKATGVERDDRRSDIFFLGCIFYHLLAGRAPLQETRDRRVRASRQRFTDIPPISRIEPSLPPYVAATVNKAMQFTPDVRYQTPKQMLKDLDAAIELLNAAAIEKVPEGGSGEGGDAERELPTLMFVGSNVRLQNLMREGLKRSGYRVLVTGDTQRALDRFRDDTIAVPDGIIISTDELGRDALDAFNRFGEDEHTQQLPAMLLLGEEQSAWRGDAQVSDCRGVLTMPIRFKEFREVLTRIMRAGNGGGSE